MPRLPVPDSNPTLPRPVYSGEQFGALQGRALQGLGQTVSDVGDALLERQAQRELSTLNAEFAKAQAELTIAWRERLRTADPNDENLASDFQQEVQARLTAIGGMAKTREAKEHFTRLSAGLSANMLTTTTAGQMDLAEVKALSDLDTSLNQLADSVSADPGSYAATKVSLEIMLDGFQRSGGLSTEARLKLSGEAKRNLARSAARGLVEANPQRARELVASGAFSEDLTGDDRAQLISYADGAIAAQEAARRKATEEAASLATTEYLRAAVRPDGSVDTAAIPALMAAVVRDPRLANAPGADQQRTMFNMLRGLAEAEASGKSLRTDPSVFRDLYSRSVLPPGDPNRATEAEIFGAVGEGRLTREDANALLDRRKGENTTEGRIFNRMQETAFSAAARFIAGSDDIALQDPQGAIQNVAFQNWALTEIERLRETGMPTQEIFAPGGPIMGRIPQFKRSTTEVIDGLREVASTARRQQPAAQPLNTTFNGKPVTELSPAELDEFLKSKK